MPAVRFPFNKLAFLTFNTTAQFRNTFWTDSVLTEIVNGIERPTAHAARCADLAPFRRADRRRERPDAGQNLGRPQERVRAAIPSLD